MEPVALAIAGILSTVLSHIISRRERNEESLEAHTTPAREGLKKGLLGLFPAVYKRVLADTRLPTGEIKAMERLLKTVDSHFHDRFTALVEREIPLVPSLEFKGDFQPLDLFSIEALGDFFRNVRDERNMKGPSDEALSIILPRLVTGLLLEAAGGVELSHLIQTAQLILLNERLAYLEKKDRISDESALKVIGEYLQNENLNKRQDWIDKLAGYSLADAGLFPYMKPSLRLVERQDGEVPTDFESHAVETSLEDLKSILRRQEKRKVLLVAGAGAGKTTFLLRLCLDLLKETDSLKCVPLYSDVQELLDYGGTLDTWLGSRLRYSEIIDYRKELAEAIAARLYAKAQLCLLFDSLDQTRDIQKMTKRFSGSGANAYLGKNPVVVACRSEDIRGNFDRYKGIFRDYEWILLEKFSETALREYLGEETRRELGYDGLDEDFRDLLRIPFYANICKRACMNRAGGSPGITTRTELLDKFTEELFQDAESRNITAGFREKESIREFLYLLSLDTLSAKPKPFKQTFPREFKKRYGPERAEAVRLIFDNTQWLYANPEIRQVFERPGAKGTPSGTNSYRSTSPPVNCGNAITAGRIPSGAA